MQIGWIVPERTLKSILHRTETGRFEIFWKDLDGKLLSIDGPFKSREDATRHIVLWTNMREQTLPTHILELDKSAAHKAR